MRGDPIPKIPLEEKAVQEASTHASVQQYIKTAKNFKKRWIFFYFLVGKTQRTLGSNASLLLVADPGFMDKGG